MKNQSGYTPSMLYKTIETTRRFDYLLISLSLFAATWLAILKAV